MKLFDLVEYARSMSSAPECIGDLTSEYGKKQINSIAEFNGLNETLRANDYANVIPLGVDSRTAAAMQYIQDTLIPYGGEVFISEIGEVFASKNTYPGYTSESLSDDIWSELDSYGEDTENV